MPPRSTCSFRCIALHSMSFLASFPCIYTGDYFLSCLDDVSMDGQGCTDCKMLWRDFVKRSDHAETRRQIMISIALASHAFVH